MTEADILGLYVAGHLSPEVALARLLLAGDAPDRIAARLAPIDTPRARALEALIAERRAELVGVQSMLRRVDHAGCGSTPADAVQRIRAMFDDAVAVAPEASVAVYSLGDPKRLRSATEELVAWLTANGLIRPESDVLDLGCGIGRVASALAPLVRSVLGLDISASMVAEARRRSVAPNVRFETTTGIDLAALPPSSIDLVLAVDSFPYLMQAGAPVVERHVADAARLLRPSGALAILNLSYRADPAADAADAARWAASHGFVLGAAGDAPFRLWDGRAFVLRGP